MAASLVLVTLLSTGFARAGNQAASEKKDPLSLVKMAVAIAVNTQHQDLDGYFANYVAPEQWAVALKDEDLGPFLKLKEQKPGRSVVIVMPPSLHSPGATVCVYFDGDKPFGMTAAKGGDGHKILASDISVGYQAVTGKMTVKTTEEFQFESGTISTDDGDPIPSYQIKSKAKKPVQ